MDLTPQKETSNTPLHYCASQNTHKFMIVMLQNFTKISHVTFPHALLPAKYVDSCEELTVYKVFYRLKLFFFLGFKMPSFLWKILQPLYKVHVMLSCPLHTRGQISFPKIQREINFALPSCHFVILYFSCVCFLYLLLPF